MNAVVLSALVITSGLLIACSATEETPPAETATQEKAAPENGIEMAQFTDADLGEDPEPKSQSLKEAIQNMTPEEVAARKKLERENPADFVTTSVKLIRNGEGIRNRIRFVMRNRAYFTHYSNVEIAVDYIKRDNSVLQTGIYKHLGMIKPLEIVESHHFQGEENPENWHHNTDGLDSRSISAVVVADPGS